MNDNENYIDLRLDGQVGVITLNRPQKHNATNDVMHEQLGDATREAAADPAVRCILLRGEGKSFCAGRDVSVMGERPGGISDFDYVRHAQEIRLAMLDCPKPIVAAVRGAAIGGGFEIALAADMRVLAKSAKMSLPEIKYGLLPDTGGHAMLTSLLGPSRAKYLIMTGETIEAEEAYRIGIGDWLVEDEELDDTALDIVRRIAAGPPQALAMAKQLVDGAWRECIRRTMGEELLAQSTLFQSEDYREARAALREKRRPQYTGR